MIGWDAGLDIGTTTIVIIGEARTGESTVRRLLQHYATTRERVVILDQRSRSDEMARLLAELQDLPDLKPAGGLSLAQHRRALSLAAIASHQRAARRNRPRRPNALCSIAAPVNRTCSLSSRWMVQV